MSEMETETFYWKKGVRVWDNGGVKDFSKRKLWYSTTDITFLPHNFDY